jgi:hypothetical protein
MPTTPPSFTLNPPPPTSLQTRAVNQSQRAGQPPRPHGQNRAVQNVADDTPASAIPGTPTRPFRIYPFGVKRRELEQAITNLGVPATIVDSSSDADMVMTIKSLYRKGGPHLRQAEAEGLQVRVLKSNTIVNIESTLRNIFEDELEQDPIKQAMYETEEAIFEVLENRAASVRLAPRPTFIRRLQHQLAEKYKLMSSSEGDGTQRRVRISRND